MSTDATKHYSTREAARILATTETRVRSWARLGGLESKQGADERAEFTFQELLLLRTTRGLLDAGIPAHRVRRVWSSLRRQLAADLPLTSVRILADGARAVAWDENASWQPDSGQFLLDFDAEELAGRAEALPALAMVDAAGPLRDVRRPPRPSNGSTSRVSSRRPPRLKHGRPICKRSPSTPAWRTRT